MSENNQYTCGQCNWLINSYCNNFADHECFTHFDDNLHNFVVDEEMRIYITTKLQNTEIMVENNNEQEPVDDYGKFKWSHEAILCLISLYKKHIQDFNSTREQNDKVWGRLSSELIANGFKYTTNQCKFKFKYLKSKYMQKKDNMKSVSSGEACVKFRYFNEIDDIFGKKANVQPTHLASNLIQRNVNNLNEETANLLTDDENHTELPPNIEAKNGETPIKNKKRNTAKSSIENLITEIRENSKIREESRKQRHEENMQFKNKMLDTFSSKLDALINVFNK